ncbi:hypothetical protein DA075_08960 [Methylobacterium currus]|uniref:Uncharacterized protein n=1 Tax=Methylobacterium currus TaxID=2051553 RepID=A0A2R4WHM4_9HYPH|nr:hypothetical protein DA075_08960 [Methylobacterium currus]
MRRRCATCAPCATPPWSWTLTSTRRSAPRFWPSCAGWPPTPNGRSTRAATPTRRRPRRSRRPARPKLPRSLPRRHLRSRRSRAQDRRRDNMASGPAGFAGQPGNRLEFL